MTESEIQTQASDQWAIVELMGHGVTVGRISRPGDWGGMLRVDVPDGEAYRTEFYGISALYAVRLVSEEIARAYAKPVHRAVSYNSPIVTREQYDSDMGEMRNRLQRAIDSGRAARRQLTATGLELEPESGTAWEDAPF